MQPIEKLGAFYLGQEYDLEQAKRTDNLIMYDARDLTTHAVCVGMTGSGKTGLCVDLLEEAAIDNIPAILIDPKGDLTNLLLTFPELRTEDFEPWINPDDARRKGMTIPEFAASTAESWRKGLADWGQDPSRISRLKQSADVNIYTPGSDAGLPVSILHSLQAPGLDWDDDSESVREQIQGTVSAILGLVGIDADPLRSREHILLANIFEHYWSQGQDLDLMKLISAVQNPPLRQVGVFDVDTFFPQKDRFELAMALNNIIAAPTFSLWLKGEPLDVAKLLHTPDGKPRHSIFYIAHLNDAERMFFVTLLLEQIITWMRRQSGTTSLRALLYFDELFGFFPPVANPPSKQPLLTLLKQARAFGLGVMLTTQNPVDIDYKGLSNAGTWFIGKLQTEQDKARVLDGLEAASSTAGHALQRSEIDRLISSLSSRVFLLHNVHADGPVVFQTRWAMSYLRGPLTRPQIRQLMAAAKAPPATVSDASSAAPAVAAASAAPAVSEIVGDRRKTAPSLPPDLEQCFLPVRTSPPSALSRLESSTGRRITPTETNLVYEPALIALGRVRFEDRTRRVSHGRDVSLLVPASSLGSIIRWDDADPLTLEARDLQRQGEPDASYGAVPPELATAARIKALGKEFADYLYREQTLDLLYNPALKLWSTPGETARDFSLRLQQAARERRDAEADKLRAKYQTKLARIEDRLRKEELELSEDRAEYEARKREEMISGAESVIGFLGVLGRRRSARAISVAATKRRLTTKAQADIAESEEQIKRLQAELANLRAEMEQEAQEIAARWEAASQEMEKHPIRPTRTGAQVLLAALGWAPYWELGYTSASGQPAYERVPAWKD